MVDPAIRRGVFGREINRSKPELNSRDGHAPPRQIDVLYIRQENTGSPSETVLSLGDFVESELARGPGSILVEAKLAREPAWSPTVRA